MCSEKSPLEPERDDWHVPEMPTAQTSEPFRLSGQQRAMYESLLGKDPTLARIYLGALMVFISRSNPDFLALSAHGLRELMEKLPQFVDVEIKARKEKLGEKVRSLEQSWLSAVSKTKCYNSQKWCGEIDSPLARFLGRAGGFFQWFAGHIPRRKEEAAQTLRELEGSGRLLPEPLEELNVESWDRMWDFFVSVAHHNNKKDISAKEFAQWVDGLERFLLDRLRPRTFADLDLIDIIIREGESDA